MYFDYTGKFPIRSRDGNTEIFAPYNWSSNAIIKTPVKDLTYTSSIATFKENIN